MTRVLITGCAGFIGSNLAQRCLGKGWDVSGVDDLSNGHIKFLPMGINFTHGDFTRLTVLDKIVAKQYDVVIHLAAVPRVSYSVEHPLETNDVNVSRTLKLIDACKGNVKRFVFASSSSVYGGADTLPTPVGYPKNPQSPYALQKSIIEDYLRLYRQLYGLDSVSLRFFNVFGPNALGDSPYATAVSAWLTAIHKGLPMRSDGDGSQSRDMCYVDNVTHACIKAASCSSADLRLFDRFNVACGESVTNSEVLAFLLKRYPQSSFVNAPARPGDVMHTLADITSTETVLGYKPIVRFWEGLELTMDWYERQWHWVKNIHQSM